MRRIKSSIYTPPLIPTFSRWRRGFFLIQQHCPYPWSHTTCINHREVVNADIARSNISIHTVVPLVEITLCVCNSTFNCDIGCADDRKRIRRKSCVRQLLLVVLHHTPAMALCIALGFRFSLPPPSHQYFYEHYLVNHDDSV